MMIVMPSFSRKTIWALSSRVLGGGDVGRNVRKTKVVGWRLKVSVARSVERAVSPGADGLLVMVAITLREQELYPLKTKYIKGCEERDHALDC